MSIGNSAFLCISPGYACLITTRSCRTDRCVFPGTGLETTHENMRIKKTTTKNIGAFGLEITA